jgi:hypothetical protein
VVSKVVDLILEFCCIPSVAPSIVVEGRTVVSSIIDVILEFCCVVSVAPSVVVPFSAVLDVPLGVNCTEV